MCLPGRGRRDGPLVTSDLALRPCKGESREDREDKAADASGRLTLRDAKKHTTIQGTFCLVDWLLGKPVPPGDLHTKPGCLEAESLFQEERLS